MLSRETQTNHSLKRRLITVHSQKGGVGKTIIAIYVARQLTELYANENKMKTVLIDADLTGTSIADVLELVDPDCNRAIDTIKKSKEHRENIGFFGFSRDIIIYCNDKVYKKANIYYGR